MFKRINYFLRNENDGATSESAGATSDASNESSSSGFGDLTSSDLEQYGLSASDFDDSGDAQDAVKTEKDQTQNADLTPEQMLEQIAKEGEQTGGEQPNADSKWLESVNGLGLSHEGNPFKVESPDQLKELVQKGYDYTRNMQALKGEQEQIEKLLDQKITEFETSKKEHSAFFEQSQKFDYALQRMKSMSPELYEEVASFVKNVESEIENPYLKSMAERLTKTEKALQERLQEIESKSVVTDWEKEQAIFSKKIESTIGKLGIKPDWNKVKEQWSKNDSESVEKAFYAAYGKEIADRFASRSRVEDAKTKAAALKTMKGVGGANTSNKGKQEIDISKMTEHEAAYALAKQYM